MTTTCQICARAIKAKKGVIAHHGYKRPGQGWQTASCFGARYRPYEVACDALPKAIASIEQFITRLEIAHLEHVYELPAVIKVLSKRSGTYGQMIEIARPAGFIPGHRFGPAPDFVSHVAYHDAYNRELWDTESQLRFAHQDLAFMKKRLAEWKAPQ